MAPLVTITPSRFGQIWRTTYKENNKNVAALKGSAVFNVAKYDETTGELAGVFESIQPSDTDLGSKAPKDVKITGLWYMQLN